MVFRGGLFLLMLCVLVMVVDVGGELESAADGVQAGGKSSASTGGGIGGAAAPGVTPGVTPAGVQAGGKSVDTNSIITSAL